MYMTFHLVKPKKYIFTNVGMVKKLHDPDLSKQLQKIEIIKKKINKCSSGKYPELYMYKESKIDLSIIKLFRYLCDKLTQMSQMMMLNFRKV